MKLTRTRNVAVFRAMIYFYEAVGRDERWRFA